MIPQSCTYDSYCFLVGNLLYTLIWMHDTVEWSISLFHFVLSSYWAGHIPYYVVWLFWNVWSGYMQSQYSVTSLLIVYICIQYMPIPPHTHALNHFNHQNSYSFIRNDFYVCISFQSGHFSEDMIPTVGFNMRKVTKGNVTIKVF